MENMLKVRIKGTSTLLMHNSRLANPLDEMTKKLKSLTGIRQKADEVHEDIAEIEFEGGLYFDPEIGPYIPDAWIDKAILEAARLRKKGKDIERGAKIIEDCIPLEYEGPRTLDALKREAKFRDVRPVVIAKNRTMRCRPCFRDWSCEFHIQFDPSILNRENLMHAIVAAGQLIGIGDYRPRFGRFSVEAMG